MLKKKSVLVVFLSSALVSLVLVLTLIGYVFYLEWKDKESDLSYRYLLNRINAKLYVKYVDVSRLNAKIEGTGPLKGNPIVEGLITNKTGRDILDLLLKVKFLDKDGAVIYEVIFHPQDPAFGQANLMSVSIPYIYRPSRVIIKSGGSLPFKKILEHCPQGIQAELASGSKNSDNKWPGKFVSEIISVEF